MGWKSHHYFAWYALTKIFGQQEVKTEVQQKVVVRRKGAKCWAFTQPGLMEDIFVKNLG